MINWAELQLAILKTLWKQENATVHEIIASLTDERPPAYTTILTVLSTLEKQGVVGHEPKPGTRMFQYRALISEEEVQTEAAADMIVHLFDGSPAFLIKLLLYTQPFEAQELSEIAQAVTDCKTSTVKTHLSTD